MATHHTLKPHAKRQEALDMLRALSARLRTGDPAQAREMFESLMHFSMSDTAGLLDEAASCIEVALHLDRLMAAFAQAILDA